MSIASDYRDRCVAAKKEPRCFYEREPLCGRASVLPDGSMEMSGKLTALAALRLAAWIQETFGEGGR